MCYARLNWEREKTLTVKFEYKYEHWEEENYTNESEKNNCK